MRIKSYTNLEKISKGGFGTVYKAEHTALGRTDAIKVLEKYSQKKAKPSTTINFQQNLTNRKLTINLNIITRAMTVA